MNQKVIMISCPTVTQNFSLANVSKLDTVGVSKMARAMIVTREMYSVPVNHQLLYVLYLRTCVMIVIMSSILCSSPR